MRARRTFHGEVCLRAMFRVALPALIVGGTNAAPLDAAPGIPETTPETAIIEVVITHAETGRPLSGVLLRLRPIERGLITDTEGRALFTELPERPLTLRADHIGFAPVEREVTPRSGESIRLDIELTPTVLHLPGIVVTGTGRERGVGEVYRPTTSLSGTELQRSLASSVPATLESVPGFHVQYNGPGAARPSIRGMSSDRVLVLEDGSRTGDLYQTSSDHGVMVEPLTAQRMEVVRGPAGLLYGANALGGIVNVIRNDVPRALPTGMTGALSTQLESVSRGGGVGGFVLAPVGPLALRAEGSFRRHGDTETPLGRLDRTALRASDGSLGASWIPSWGFVGGAVRRYENLYGVPGEFDGQLIPGGHPGGVEIETSRTTARFRAAYLQPFLGFFDSAELEGSVVRYLHDEIEATIAGEPVLGARFDQTSAEAKVIARHDHTGHDHHDQTLRSEGAYGAAFERRGLRAGGVSPGTRSGDDLNVAVFGYEEFTMGRFRLQLGFRGDHRRIDPSRLDPIRVRTIEREVVKEVTPRRFNGISGSVAVLRDMAEGWTVGASVARSVRPPSIEQLYSAGPHLADFSFDIGSPDLDPEVGIGLDLFMRGSRRTVSVEGAIYANFISGYLQYARTGETVRVLRDGVPPRITPVYEAAGEDALFVGAEARVQWEMRSGLALDLTGSFTRAERRDDGDPLPAIPPLGARAELRYETGPWSFAFGTNGAAAQNRVPRAIEIGDRVEHPDEPTPAYALLNAGVGWRGVALGRFHSVTLEARNLTDRAWRDHLSRIREIAPQPGRNLQFAYRVTL